MTDHEATLMLDSDTAPITPSSRRSLSWLLAGGVVGLVGVGYLSRHSEAHPSFKADNKLLEQAENCASGGQPSSCTAPEVAVMTSYGAWTVCGPNAGLPTQTGVFVGGIEACEATCAASSTCKGIQWVQGADSTQDICYEIVDNICVHHTMTPPVAQGSVPPVQNAECIVKSCGDGPGGECVAGQTQCCPASLKREVNVAGDKLVQRFARRLLTTQQREDARVIKTADGTVVVCDRATNQGYWAIGTVTRRPGEDITQTLNPHLKVISENGKDLVVRYDPDQPNGYVVVGEVADITGITPGQPGSVRCPVEAVQFEGRKLMCATGQIKPLQELPADCPLPLPAGWSPNAAFDEIQDATPQNIDACKPVDPMDTGALCPTQVFAAADHKAIVCDANLNVLGMVNTIPTGVTVDDRATVRYKENQNAFTDIIVQNPPTAEGGQQDLGTVVRKGTANGENFGIWSCAGIACSTTSTCDATAVLPSGKWLGLLCVGVSPLPANLRGVFWKENKGAKDDFALIPDLIAFCQNTDGCGKSLGQINAEGQLIVDFRGEKVVDWLGTAVETADIKALSWIKENGFCKLTFSSVAGKGSRHSPTWFRIEASCDNSESTGVNVNIPSYVMSQIDAFNARDPFMVWVHGSRYNSLLPRGCTAWALWTGLEQKRNYAQDANPVTDLEKATSKLVSVVDDRGYTLEECGYSRFDSLYGKSSVIHSTYDNGR